MYFFGVNDTVLFVITKYIYYCMTYRVIGKILDGLTRAVLILAMFSRNGCRRCCCGIQRWEKIANCLCVMGGKLEEGGYRKVTYVGGQGNVLW